MGVLCDMAMMISIHNSRGGGRGEGGMGGSERVGEVHPLCFMRTPKKVRLWGVVILEMINIVDSTIM